MTTVRLADVFATIIMDYETFIGGFAGCLSVMDEPPGLMSYIFFVVHRYYPLLTLA